MSNLYQILQVESNAQRIDIEYSFLTLKHEAIVAGNDTIPIDFAYSILSDSKKRNIYDAELLENLLPRTIELHLSTQLDSKISSDDRYKNSISAKIKAVCSDLKTNPITPRTSAILDLFRNKISFLQAIILFLCDQKKWLVYAGIFLSQVLVAADIATFILSPQFEWRQAFVGIIEIELLACFVIVPSLLLLFRIIARFVTLLGPMRATVLTIALFVVEELLTRSTQKYWLLGPVFALDIAEWTLMSAIMLFIVKGKAPFFQKKSASERLIQQDSVLQPDVSHLDEIPILDEPSSIPHEIKSLSLQEHFNIYDKGSRKMRFPLFVLALALVGFFVFNQPQLHSPIDPQQNGEQQTKLAMSEENTEQGRGNGIITPELAESMGSGSRLDFSGCIGKTTHECIESATYAKTYYDGIEFNLGISRVESCGPQARFLTVFGPKGFTTSGCWVKNGTEINLWIFMPKDSNGNYTKVSGPIVRSIEVMPYYKTHNLPDL